MSRSLATFFVVVVLAFGWRCVGLTFDSLWLDEGYQTVVDAYGQPLPDFLQVPERPFIYRPGEPSSPEQMLRNFRKVDPLTPPLYQLMLNRWIAMFGGDDFSLRMMSVCISTVCVAAVFWFAHIVFGLRVAAFAGVLQAFSPFDIYYGQEVRMYGLLALSAVLSCGLLIMFLTHHVQARWRWAAWIAYVVATWAVVNSHYCGLFLCLFEGMLGVAVTALARNWRLLGALIVSWLVVALLWVPWLPMFLQAAGLRTESFYVAREPSLWWPFYALFVKIPLNWLTFLSGKQVVPPAVPIYATSALSLILCLRGFVKGAMPRRVRLALLFVILWAIVPSVGLWAVDVLENHKVVEISRYVIATAPAIYVMAGLGFAGLKLRRPLAVALIVVHLLAATINNVAHVTVIHQREPWRNLARLLESREPDSQVLVLVAQHYNILCLNRYLTRPYRQVGVSTGLTREHIASVIGDAPRFVLITAQEGESVKTMMPPGYVETFHKCYQRGLHLRNFERSH